MSTWGLRLRAFCQEYVSSYKDASRTSHDILWKHDSRLAIWPQFIDDGLVGQNSGPRPGVELGSLGCRKKEHIKAILYGVCTMAPTEVFITDACHVLPPEIPSLPE